MIKLFPLYLRFDHLKGRSESPNHPKGPKPQRYLTMLITGVKVTARIPIFDEILVGYVVDLYFL